MKKTLSCFFFVLLFSNHILAKDEFVFDSFEENIELPTTRDSISRGKCVSSTCQDQLELQNHKIDSINKRDLYFCFESVGSLSSGSNAPFWLVSNRQGLSSLKKNSCYARFSANGSMHTPKGFFMNYGLDIVSSAGLQTNIRLQQLYADFGYKWFDISLGYKERWGELKNNSLSSGGLTWSGNCRPLPQLRIETPSFVRINNLGGWLALKGQISYGRYADNKWKDDFYSETPNAIITKDILFHSKSFFLKIGDFERFPIEFTCGLEMYAQFGGTGYNLNITDEDGNRVDKVYHLPSDIASYFEILIPFNEAGNQTKKNGNTFGSWHLSLDTHIADWKIRGYYEHFYEDHSSLLGIEYKKNSAGERRFVHYGISQNWKDGLYGLEVNAPDGFFFKDIVFEYLDTRGQCGPVCVSDSKTEDLSNVCGRDNMYFQEVYQAYQYWGYSPGTPILISPMYNRKGDICYASNRVSSFHLGIDGKVFDNLDYRFLATTTRHWGTYNQPFSSIERVSSIMLELSYWFGESYDWNIKLTGAKDFDSGDLVGNNNGVMLTISKVWDLL